MTLACNYKYVIFLYFFLDIKRGIHKNSLTNTSLKSKS